jgi:hypothetical protein
MCHHLWEASPGSPMRLPPLPFASLLSLTDPLSTHLQASGNLCTLSLSYQARQEWSAARQGLRLHCVYVLWAQSSLLHSSDLFVYTRSFINAQRTNFIIVDSIWCMNEWNRACPTHNKHGERYSQEVRIVSHEFMAGK